MPFINKINICNCLVFCIKGGSLHFEIDFKPAKSLLDYDRQHGKYFSQISEKISILGGKNNYLKLEISSYQEQPKSDSIS